MKLATLAATASLLLASSAFAGTVVPLDHFTGVSASDGARVTIRYGAVQQVTVIKGDPQISRIEVQNGKLVVETCIHDCPRHYSLEVDVVMPNLETVHANDGGSIETQGSFPAQQQIEASANDGGRVDARAIAAAHVDATATDGGDLLIQPRQSMNARAEDGGAVRYWGNPTVTSLKVEDGGTVHQES
ncbi:MAG TPA: DUF2807 domain-containing protein [Rhizomicrobium sp.]